MRIGCLLGMILVSDVALADPCRALGEKAEAEVKLRAQHAWNAFVCVQKTGDDSRAAEAAHYLQQVIAGGPKSPLHNKALWALVDLQSRRGNFRDAAQAAEDWLAQYPRSSSRRQMAVMVVPLWAEVGDVKKSLAALARAKPYAKRSAREYAHGKFMVAQLLLREGQAKAANRMMIELTRRGTPASRLKATMFLTSRARAQSCPSVSAGGLCITVKERPWPKSSCVQGKELAVSVTKRDRLWAKRMKKLAEKGMRIRHELPPGKFFDGPLAQLEMWRDDLALEETLRMAPPKLLNFAPGKTNQAAQKKLQSSLQKRMKRIERNPNKSLISNSNVAARIAYRYGVQALAFANDIERMGTHGALTAIKDAKTRAQAQKAYCETLARQTVPIYQRATSAFDKCAKLADLKKDAMLAAHCRKLSSKLLGHKKHRQAQGR